MSHDRSRSSSRSRSRSPNALCKNIRVKNLPVQDTHKNLKRLLLDVLREQIPEVNTREYIINRIERDECTIKCKSIDSCRAALNKLNGFVCNGKIVSCKLENDQARVNSRSASPSKSSAYPESRHYYVIAKNLPFEDKPTVLRELILKLLKNQGSNITFYDIYIHRIFINECIIKFNTRDICEEACSKLNGLKVEGKIISAKIENNMEVIREKSKKKKHLQSKFIQAKQSPSNRPQFNELADLAMHCETYGLSFEFLRSLNINQLHSCVFVGKFDLNSTITEGKLREIFRCAGEIVQVSIFKKGESMFAKIDYDHPVEAVQAISMLNNQVIYGERVFVKMDSNAKKYLPEGVSGFGHGLGINGTPMKSVRTTLEIKRIEDRFTNEINSLKSIIEDLKSQLPAQSAMSQEIQSQNPMNMSNLNTIQNVSMPQNMLQNTNMSAFAPNVGQMFGQTPQPMYSSATAQAGQIAGTFGQMSVPTIQTGVVDVMNPMGFGQVNPMTGQLPNQMTGQMLNQMTAQMPNQMTGQMPNQMTGQMSNQMPNQITGQMESQMTGQMSNQMTNQMSNQMTGQMPNQITGQMESQMSNQMTGQMSNQMTGQMPNQMTGQMQNQITGQMESQNSSHMFTTNAHSGWAQSDSHTNLSKDNNQLSNRDNEKDWNKSSDGNHKKPTDTLMFSKLPLSVTEKVFAKKMTEIGDFKFARITGKGSAIICFNDERVAMRCMELFHHSTVDGQLIEVKYL